VCRIYHVGCWKKTEDASVFRIWLFVTTRDVFRDTRVTLSACHVQSCVQVNLKVNLEQPADMNSARTNTPLTGNSQFIQAGEYLSLTLFWFTNCRFFLYFPDDDDDLDEENLPGFSIGPPPPDKGKGRAHAQEQLAPPSNNAGTSSPVLSGRIGAPLNGAPPPTRQTVGGVQVETRCVLWFQFFLMLLGSFACRYAGADTLDEPVTTTIVRRLAMVNS
jgi:protein YIPF6